MRQAAAPVPAPSVAVIVDDAASPPLVGIAFEAALGEQPAPPTEEPAEVTVPTTGWAAFDAVVNSRLVGRGDVSASVAVMIDGEILHAAAYGERARGSGEPALDTDRFRIASISKVITATVTLQLADAGELDLRAPIAPALSEYLGIDITDANALALTPLHLLSHNSGFGKYQSTFFGRGADSCREAAVRGLTSAVGAPGSYQYSNMNFCVLGMLIEAVTGQSLEDATYERLLTPLGITGMRLAGTFDTIDGEVEYRSTAGRNYMETLGGAGSWKATARDIVKILGALNPDTPGWKPLSVETLGSMRVPPFGPVPEPNQYGLGLILYPNGYGHTGTIEEVHAMTLTRNDGVTWAILANGTVPSNSSSLSNVFDEAFAAGFGGAIPTSG